MHPLDRPQPRSIPSDPNPNTDSNPDSLHAVIDIGSNSVKLLVARRNNLRLLPVLEEGTQTRLGTGLYETGRLQPEAIQLTATVVRDYLLIARNRGALSTRVIATSAAREASNSADLRQAILQTAGCDLEIISGNQEAQWAFHGALSAVPTFSEPILVFDVGGGSTEFIVGNPAEIQFQHSYPLGAVRLLNCIQPSDPPTPAQRTAAHQSLRDLLLSQIVPDLQAALPSRRAPRLALATGGTAAILACLDLGRETWDRGELEGYTLAPQRLQHIEDLLWNLPIADRRRLPGLPADRADILLTGAAIFRAIQTHLQLQDLRTCTRGLRFGALLAPWTPRPA